MQGPERFLLERRVTLPCAVDARRPARIEPGLRAYVNHKIYFFSDRAGMAKFRRDPLRYCGLVTDPVSRGRFKPTASSPRLEYGGRSYFFENRLDLETFSAMPDSFAQRRGM